MKMIKTIAAGILLLTFLFGAACMRSLTDEANVKQPVDYVNPYMGNISHLLVPTYPTIHLPNSMLQGISATQGIYRNQLHGLPLAVTSHRGSPAFSLSPFQGDEIGMEAVIKYSYDREKLTPYSYSVWLDEQQITVEFGLSHQSAAL